MDRPTEQDFTAPSPGVLPQVPIEVSTPLPSPFLPDGSFLGATIPVFTDEGNRNGFEREQRVGSLLSRLPYVAQVRQSELDGTENAELIDLIADMIPGFAVPWVNVQVKSNSMGNRAFYAEVAKRMKKEGKLKGKSGEESHAEKRQWMNARRLVLINGGFKNGEIVTDEYIVQKFITQVAEIVRYEREQRTQREMLARCIRGLYSVKTSVKTLTTAS